MYRINFTEKYDDNVVYLCEHENEIVERLLRPVEDAILVWPKEPGNHNDYFVVVVSEPLTSIILNRGYDFKVISDYTLYTGVVIEDTDSYYSTDNSDVMDTLEFVSLDEWFRDFEQKVDKELKVTDEEREEHQLALDILDNWIAKGRESQRSKERGEKYLKNI